MKKKENNLKVKSSIIASCIIVCIVMLIIVTIVVTVSSRKNIGLASINEHGSPKTITIDTTRQPDISKGTFHWEPSLDGYQIPVPTGYVGSSVPDEMYRDGITTSETWNLQENLTLASPEGETYPWTQVTATGNSLGAWRSENYNVASSTSTIESNSFTVSEAAVVRINWSVGCEASANTDYVYYTITNTSTGAVIGGIGTQEARINGTGYVSNVNSLTYIDADVELEAGTYKVEITFTKNASSNSGLDSAYVKSIGVYTKSATGSSIEVYTREHTGGFVIYEGTEAATSNQYVWVPVERTEVEKNMYYYSTVSATKDVIYGKYYDFTAAGYGEAKTGPYEPLVVIYDVDQSYLKQYLEGISRNEFLNEMREEFVEMLESVATYGGFYIGRYETGNINHKVPVVVKGNINISSVQWYLMYKRCKNLKGANKSVQTGLIWGIQWDETLKWLIDTKEKTAPEVGADSTSWGNYYNSTVSGHGRLRATGYSEVWKANNIYDLAGNALDWTMESNGSFDRRYRGGEYNNYGSGSPAQSRSNSGPNNSHFSIGARASLYLL